MLRLCIVAAALGLAASVPVAIEANKLSEILRIENIATRNNFLENILLGLLEDARETMLNGSDTVPVLDPLVVNEIAVDDEILPMPGAGMTAKDITVTQLSTFVVDSLSINMASLIPQRYRMQLELHIPNFLIDVGNYDLSLPNVFGANIFGNGEGKINIIEPRIKANILIAPRFSISSGIFISMVSSEVQFSLTAFEPQITGMLNDEGVSDFINLFLKNLVPELLEFFETEITEFLSATVLEVGNDILSDLNLGSILG